MKLQTQLLLISLSFGLSGLTGCVNTSPKTLAVADEQAILAQANKDLSDSVKKSSVKLPPKAEDYPVASFEGDALYRLLVAEVAGYRRDFKTSLENYLVVAENTKDPGVAARATRLAAYLKKPDLELRAALIWAEAEPKNIYAHRHAADKLMRAGKLPEAIGHMEAVRNLGGLANFEVFAYRASGLDEEGRASLLESLNQLGKRYVDDEQIMFSRAVLLRQSGELETALTLVNRLLEIEAKTDVVVLKVNILKNLERGAEAVTFLNASLAAETAPDRRLRVILARLLFDEKRLDDARQQYEFVLRETPSDGNILFALALIAMEQEQNVAAKGYLQQMVRWNRRVSEAHFYLGSLAEREKDRVLAISEYKQVGRGYEFLPAQSRISQLMVESGNLNEMRHYLANLRGEDSDNADQLVMIEAQLLADEGDSTAVFDLLDGVIAQQPNEIGLLYFRGLTGQRFERFDIMERDLAKVIELEPDNSDALNALGYTLADQTERYQEAFELISRALAIKPDEAAFIDSMGWVLYRLKDFDQAIVHLRRALEIFVNDEVAAHLGEVLWVSGDEQEASDVWQKALETTPNSEILKSVIERFAD